MLLLRMGVQASHRVSAFGSFGLSPEVEFLDHEVIVGLFYEVPPYCLPQPARRLAVCKMFLYVCGIPSES